MSEADKLFKKLDYKLNNKYKVNVQQYIVYEKIEYDNLLIITFNLRNNLKHVCKYRDGSKCPINSNEIEAIYFKMKELGWL